MYVWACVCPGWISMWLSIWFDASQEGEGLLYANRLKLLCLFVSRVVSRSISVLFILGCMCERVCVQGEFQCDWAFGLMPPRKATAFHMLFALTALTAQVAQAAQNCKFVFMKVYLCIIHLALYVWACVCPGWISMWLSIWVDASQKNDSLS